MTIHLDFVSIATLAAGIAVLVTPRNIGYYIIGIYLVAMGVFGLIG